MKRRPGKTRAANRRICLRYDQPGAPQVFERIAADARAHGRTRAAELLALVNHALAPQVDERRPDA